MKLKELVLVNEMNRYMANAIRADQEDKMDNISVERERKAAQGNQYKSQVELIGGHHFKADVPVRRLSGLPSKFYVDNKEVDEETFNQMKAKVR
jgi:hypothetical protein